MRFSIVISLLLIALLCSASFAGIPVIFDTDANNELDDQHALAYLLMNGDVFDTIGITVNRTNNGGGVENHLAEAVRVTKLVGVHPTIPVLKGADGSYEDIAPSLSHEHYNGHDAVEFIIKHAREEREEKLVLLPVGKLTNIALALHKAPDIADKVRVVWLGSNYPDPGEYNQDNDEGSLRMLLEADVPFEIVTVRYGNGTGTTAVRVTPEEINETMPGLGPHIDPPIRGRHGGTFHSFGEYSVSLFEHAHMHGTPPGRSLFDMAAVAILKNPEWAEVKTIPAPWLNEDRSWSERPENTRKVIIWENFDRDAIIEDFFDTMKNYTLDTP